MRLVRLALVLVALALVGIGAKVVFDGARARRAEGVDQVVATAQAQREVLLTAAAVRTATATATHVAPVAPTATTAGSVAPTATAVAPSREYVVQAGDTLSSIAERLDVGVEALAQENGLADPNLLQVGQVLKLP